MTNIEIYRNKDKNIVRYRISGHSGYGKAGKDIVCAAVSSVSQAAVMGLVNVLEIDAEFEIKDAYLECAIPTDLSVDTREKANVILETMLLFLREFQEQYGKYVRIVEQEV